MKLIKIIKKFGYDKPKTRLSSICRSCHCDIVNTEDDICEECWDEADVFDEYFDPCEEFEEEN